MANKTDNITVEEKLRALYDLQLIDSRVDEIRNVRGELPLEVQDLEDEVLGLKTRMDKLKTDVETVNFEIAAKKNLIEESKALIKKYAEQQKNVRNSREFNSLSKEVEFQELEIQLAEINIKELFTPLKPSTLHAGNDQFSALLGHATDSQSDMKHSKVYPYHPSYYPSIPKQKENFAFQ